MEKTSAINDILFFGPENSPSAAQSLRRIQFPCPPHQKAEIVLPVTTFSYACAQDRIGRKDPC
jgi:hypothetical protein